ncbi:hypothetical protein [Halanaerobaculum tunisiense]
MAKKDSNVEPSFLEKEHEHAQAKKLIGRQAAKALVGPATENHLQHLHADKVFY